MKRIYLRGKYSHLYACVDDCDYESLIKFNWFASATTYAQRNTWVNKRNGRELMHHRILPKQDGLYVDHIDGNRLNNQRGNLRYVTPTQSLHNRQRRHNAKSPYKGMYWHRHKEKWGVRITVNKVVICLGYYLDPKEAAIVYDMAAKRYFGEYAKLNFPEGPA